MRIPPNNVWATWPWPNYEDPETQGPSLIIVNAIFMILVVLAVAGRLYSRLCIQKWFGVDDAMMVLAFVGLPDVKASKEQRALTAVSQIFTIAMTTVVVLADVKYYWDHHVYDLPPDIVESTNIIAFVAKLTFTLAATFTRLSLICFYYRLIKDSGIRWFVWVLHASVVWQIALCITFVSLTVWLCDPVESYWQFPPPASYKCLDEGKVMLGGGIVSSFSDLMTVVLPIPIVMRLQMPLWHRIGVCVLLCLGLVVTVAGSLRTYYTWKSLMDSYDETWYAYPLWIAAAVEIDVGVICACAPALKSLLQRPIRNLSSKISSKLSSLRSPSNTQDDSGAKPSIFNPLRSLPWFQITKMDFERTRKGDGTYYGRDAEQDSSSAFELYQKDHMQRPCDDEIQQEASATDFRSSDGARTASPRPGTPSLQIMMRQSFDQCSDYVGSSYQPPSPERSRPNGPVSGEWLSSPPR